MSRRTQALSPKLCALYLCIATVMKIYFFKRHHVSAALAGYTFTSGVPAALTEEQMGGGSCLGPRRNPDQA